MATKNTKAANAKVAPKQAAAQEAQAPKQAPAAEQAAPVAEVKARGPKGVSEAAVVTLIAKTNPKREGSKSHARFASYTDGMTVGEALDAGITTPDLVYDTEHGFISIDGYTPKNVYEAKPKKEPKPKAEKTEKTAKGGKVKVELTAEQKAALAVAEKEASEETME